MDCITALRQFSFFTDAPESIQAEIKSAASWAKLNAGDHFVRDGAMCHQFAVMVSGSLRVYKSSKSGREITLYHVQPGQPCLANMLCAILDAPAPANAVAEAQSTALIMPAASFRRWVNQCGAVREFMLQAIANRFLELTMLVEEVAFQRLDSRLAEYLQRASVKDGVPVRELNVTHEEIAAELGSAREVISRLLKEFERLGAVETARGRIILRGLDNLRSITRAARDS